MGHFNAYKNRYLLKGPEGLKKTERTEKTEAGEPQMWKARVLGLKPDPKAQEPSPARANSTDQTGKLPLSVHSTAVACPPAKK